MAGLDEIQGKRTYEQIKSYLDVNRALLDVNGDGTVSALTDGLVITRYLFGLRGAPLVSDALSDEPTRSDPDSVEAAIRALMP